VNFRERVAQLQPAAADIPCLPVVATTGWLLNGNRFEDWIVTPTRQKLNQKPQTICGSALFAGGLSLAHLLHGPSTRIVENGL
jgi:hypothetical protein